MEKQFTRLGIVNTGAGHLESYIRSLIVSKACYYGIRNCTDEAKDLLQKYMDDPKSNP